MDFWPFVPAENPAAADTLVTRPGTYAAQCTCPVSDVAPQIFLNQRARTNVRSAANAIAMWISAGTWILCWSYLLRLAGWGFKAGDPEGFRPTTGVGGWS